tara:strand:- start:4541 stop:4759 length:219 start_codon:yes stop_codon:yes gene_type:complete
MFAMPKTKTKKLKKTSNITIILPETEMGTISPKPTEEKVIKLKYKNSKNCLIIDVFSVSDVLKLSTLIVYKA